jgi:hypothetical protein
VPQNTDLGQLIEMTYIVTMQKNTQGVKYILFKLFHPKAGSYEYYGSFEQA